MHAVERLAIVLLSVLGELQARRGPCSIPLGADESQIGNHGGSFLADNDCKAAGGAGQGGGAGSGLRQPRILKMNRTWSTNEQHEPEA